MTKKTCAHRIIINKSIVNRKQVVTYQNFSIHQTYYIKMETEARRIPRKEKKKRKKKDHLFRCSEETTSSKGRAIPPLQRDFYHAYQTRIANKENVQKFEKISIRNCLQCVFLVLVQAFFIFLLSKAPENFSPNQIFKKFPPKHSPTNTKDPRSFLKKSPLSTVNNKQYIAGNQGLGKVGQMGETFLPKSSLNSKFKTPKLFTC